MKEEEETIWRGLGIRFVRRQRHDPRVTLAAFARAINVPSYEKLRRYVVQAREEASAGILPVESIGQAPDTKSDFPLKLGADHWNEALLKLRGPDEAPFLAASISCSEHRYQALFGTNAPPFRSEAAQVLVGTLGDRILNSGDWLLVAERALIRALPKSGSDEENRAISPEGPLGPFTFRRGGPAGAFFKRGEWTGASVFITRSDLVERGIAGESFSNSQMAGIAQRVGGDLERSSWGADAPGICAHLMQQFSAGKLYRFDEPGEGVFVSSDGQTRGRAMWLPSRAAYWKMRLKKPDS